MTKLLSANFSRLFKDKIFWLGTFIMFGIGIFAVCTKYSDIIRYNEHELLDDAMLVYAAVIGCFSSVFCSLFIGTEYSDGTLRNKLAVGHLRSAVYLSSWLTTIAASVIMAFAYIFSYCVLGVFLLEPPQASAGTILFYMLMSLFTIIAYTSLFHLVSMLVTRKSASAILCLFLFLGLIMLAMIINARLNAPEFISGYNLTVNGIEQAPAEPNPKYLQPEARKVYQFFYDILPGGQSVQLSGFTAVRPYLMMVSSAVISALATIAGVFAFRRKDLK